MEYSDAVCAFRSRQESDPRRSYGGEALAHTAKLARRADDLGYKRFWVAEHHASPFLASSAPEIVSAYLLAVTRRIRIGTGGVMLQHYSPFKVAESFRVLENLAPGRVDLGVGKAPGGLPYATQALQAFHDKATKPDFETALEQLDGFLRGPLPAPHPLSKAQPKPDIASLPGRILLGASPESAALAARLDGNFVTPDISTAIPARSSVHSHLCAGLGAPAAARAIRRRRADARARR